MHKAMHANRRYKKRKPSAAIEQLQGFTPSPQSLANMRKWRRERWEDLFLFHCRAHKLPPVAREHKFALSIGRQWRFDFAWLSFLTAVEIEGIVVQGSGENARFGFGRHHSVAGFLDDMVKYNAAQKLGWAVLRYPQKAVKSGEAIAETIEVLRRRGWSGTLWPDSVSGSNSSHGPSHGSTVSEVTHTGEPQPLPPDGCHRGTDQRGG